MQEITKGFKEKSYRPWPKYENAQFIIVNISPRFLDLCYRREEDGAIVYLASKIKE